jgi:hypothetical protein
MKILYPKKKKEGLYRGSVRILRGLSNEAEIPLIGAAGRV